MPRTDRFSERIGAVFLPEAETVEISQDFTPSPEGPFPEPEPPIPIPPIPIPFEPLPELRPVKPIEPLFPWWKFCSTQLRGGCYTLSFTPTSTSIFGTRFRGTLRVENTANGVRFSGDLYSYRLLDDFIIQLEERTVGRIGLRSADFITDEAADTGGTIPIYRRRSYHSYLKGTKARLFNIVPRGSECTFSLSFDEFVYNHPATGFRGSFPTSFTRQLVYVFKKTATPDLYTGEAWVGNTMVGTVSMRWVSSSFRRAHLQIHTLQGAETPPAVGTTTFATIFAGIGWNLTMNDGGTVPLPAALSGVNATACWSRADLHTLMASVPGYNAADLDSVWRVHLVAVPATLGCSRGVMFDSSGGADPNGVPREGTATFSRDGYPAAEVPAPMGGSHYDGAAGGQQRNFPRAFLRSATHEVGHAFNQIHQELEGGADNSIMTTTPSVASFLGTGGTFPNDVNLAFNDRVTKHLRHLPDPAVRPGAMDFFGSAVSAPEAADVAWPDPAELTIDLSSDRVRLGEPITLTFTLRNAGEVPLPAPSTLDIESLTVRINVTDPAGRITFIRPETVSSCPHITIELLEPEKSVSGETTLFWGQDGFAFETPGRHVVEVIVLWDIAGVPVAAGAERDVFVMYPISAQDNEVAALMLDPEVGVAVASGEPSRFERAYERIEEARQTAKSHPAVEALQRLGLLEKRRPRRSSGTRSRKGRS